MRFMAFAIWQAPSRGSSNHSNEIYVSGNNHHSWYQPTYQTQTTSRALALICPSAPFPNSNCSSQLSWGHFILQWLAKIGKMLPQDMPGYQGPRFHDFELQRKTKSSCVSSHFSGSAYLCLHSFKYAAQWSRPIHSFTTQSIISGRSIWWST